MITIGLTVLFFVLTFFLRKVSPNWWYFLWILPSTVLHELSHFLVGIIFFAGPKSFSLIPKRNANGSWTLGSVSFSRISTINALPVALAPLLLLILSLMSLCDSLRAETIYEKALFSILSVQFFLGSKPSIQDIRVMLSEKIGIIIYISILFFGVKYAIENHFFVDNRLSWISECLKLLSF